MLGPLILIAIGILFLLNNMYPGVFRFGKMWPVILIVIGVAKVFEYLQGHPQGQPQGHPELKPDLNRTEDKKEGQ